MTSGHRYCAFSAAIKDRIVIKFRLSKLKRYSKFIAMRLRGSFLNNFANILSQLVSNLSSVYYGPLLIINKVRKALIILLRKYLFIFFSFCFFYAKISIKLGESIYYATKSRVVNFRDSLRALEVERCSIMYNIRLQG